MIVSATDSPVDSTVIVEEAYIRDYKRREIAKNDLVRELKLHVVSAMV